MILRKEDIEQVRTAEELSAFVRDIQNRVNADDTERRKAIKGIGIYKVFVKEVIPLSVVVRHLYAADAKFLPVLGSQGYDALVYDSNGKEIDRVEIAKPYDGYAEAKDAEQVLEKGVGEFQLYELGEDLAALGPYVTAIAEKNR